MSISSFNYMIFKPQNKSIAKHIEHYWIAENTAEMRMNSSNLYAYPGVTPDMIIVLDGFFEYKLNGKITKQNQSTLYSFIPNEIELNLSNLNKFILVKFKPRVLGAIQPFVNYSAQEIMKNPFGFSKYAFNGSISKLSLLLKNLSTLEMVCFLDNWFLSHYKKEREGFVIEMAEGICTDFNLQKIMEETNYSYSTIERYFKRETGLTPKKFQSMKRAKEVVTDICTTQNVDWMYYVTKYNYYDQAHFIKDIKRFTKITPKKLLEIPSLVNYRSNS